MSEAVLGEGISPADPNTPHLTVVPDTPTVFEKPDSELSVEIRDLIRREMEPYVADAERRLAQARELEAAVFSGVPRQTVHTEDLNLSFAMIDGYTLTPNSPANGSIAWSSLHVVLLGVDYTIADGNMTEKYAWFVKPASYTPGTPVTLQKSNTMPVLGAQDALIWINNNGVPVSALESSISYAIGPGTVGDAQVSGGIAQSKISGLSQAIIDLNGGIDQVKLIAEGAVTQTFGPAFPWANGTVKDSSFTADIHTFQDTTDPANFPNGTSYRWSGPSGSPANTWVIVSDTALAKALADSASALQGVATKTTTFFANAADTPTALAAGDEWVVLDQNNKRKRATAPGTGSWVDTLIGDSALANGISGAKIGAGISPANLTGSGTIPTAGVPQLGPAKLNTPFHMLY